MKDKDPNETTQTATNEYVLQDDYVSRYDYYRNLLRELFPKFMACISREMIARSANRLRISEGNSILLNTEHESNFFFDYCIYTYKIDGLNIIRKSF